jgi:hypothetical protein
LVSAASNYPDHLTLNNVTYHFSAPSGFYNVRELQVKINEVMQGPDIFSVCILAGNYSPIGMQRRVEFAAPIVPRTRGRTLFPFSTIGNRYFLKGCNVDVYVDVVIVTSI